MSKRLSKLNIAYHTLIRRAGGKRRFPGPFGRETSPSRKSMSIASTIDVAKAMRPAFNAVWNAFGTAMSTTPTVKFPRPNQRQGSQINIREHGDL
jgi:hypothetical protein